MALNALMYEANVELINSWWVVFKKAGIRVELDAPPGGKSKGAETSNVTYWGGQVRDQDAVVFVRPYPGPSEYCKRNPLVGKYVITLQFLARDFLWPGRPDPSAELAERLGEVLLRAGAKRVPVPGD